MNALRSPSHAAQGAAAARIDIGEDWISFEDIEAMGIPGIVMAARSQAGGSDDFWAGYELELRKLIACANELINE